MKAIAILMVIALVVAVCGVGYLYMTANVSVVAVGMTATEATVQQATFDKLKTDHAENLVTMKELINFTYNLGSYDYYPGVRNDTELGEAQAYQFYTYTVRLRNFSMLTCDMVELQVTPREGDVLQMGNEQSKALSAGATGDISATVLTSVESLPVRELIITYYVWGIPFTVKTTYG